MEIDLFIPSRPPNTNWPTGGLQPCSPMPTGIPKYWPLIVLDLKDCFYNTHTHPDNDVNFALSVHSIMKNLCSNANGLYYLKARQTPLLCVNTVSERCQRL